MAVADGFAVLDVETTGGDCTRDRITEIGLLLIDDDRVVDQWCSLVDPCCLIPPEIQRLTGITQQMVSGAPTFAALAAGLAQRLGDRVLVAHQARFDYGFIKNEFKRLGLSFSADVLCTVRLSRRLTAEAPRHGLDALIDRWSIATSQRHRAFSDAKALVDLLAVWRAHYGEAQVRQAIAQIVKIPSLPPQLPADCLTDLPDAPGVYLFYGVNDAPLYIGKSKSLRTRVRAHFSADHRNANDQRLSAEVRRIEWQRTGGEFSARLLEAHWIKTRFPLLNRALRANRELVVLDLPQPRPLRVTELQCAGLAGKYGPFSSRRAARGALEAISDQHGLCWVRLGLEARDGACFSRQLRRCRGACVGADSPTEHDARLIEAMQPYRIPLWPFNGPVALRERGAQSSSPRHVHLLDQWCYLGTVEEGESIEAALTGADPTFDPHIYALLRGALAQAHQSELSWEPVEPLSPVIA